ncbi:hypothetical protein [Enterococcus casseliflavus]|uniref:hypothetical protein n=1 Tax=Enterococcus casseliflavus TaxID=37734 RepID=UPI00232C23D1|nr:hypothetical protein [Enterococcus casseliflavus]MDB1687481.1 hypothetical protein [Enterococcus casseliflavus]
MKNQNEIQKRKMAEPVESPSLNNIWTDQNAFQTAMRMANALSASTIVPRDYQGEDGLGNCMIALEMASRLNTSPLMVMQNLYVVNGRPSWSSQYIIAMINNSKKYRTELQFEFEGEGASLACTAYVEDYSGRVIKGPKITMEMARAEGWVNKNGSKWKTMPEVMIRYRAASFFGRLNCPDMIMGLYSTEEAAEIDADFIVVDDVADRIEKEINENANSELLDPEPNKEDDEKKEERPEKVNKDGEIEESTQETFDLGEEDPY